MGKVVEKMHIFSMIGLKMRAKKDRSSGGIKEKGKKIGLEKITCQ